MNLSSNYNITRLFINKEITITSDKKPIFIIKLRPIKDLYLDANWNIIYHIITADENTLKEYIPIKEIKTSFEFINLLLFQLGQFKQYQNLYTWLLQAFTLLFPQFNENNSLNISNQTITINNTIITNEIWEYIVYLLKLSCGEKVEQPLSFDSEEARKFYLAQKAAEAKINKVKSKKQVDEDALMKIMLSISYVFPSFTTDYLFNQTMAQIQWLQKYAAGAVSYEVNAQAFAAGNVKKGKKLDFFIK